jgi:amino acid transporter
MTDDPAKQAWQASVEIAGAPPLDEVRKGADKFYRYVKWRNRVEYVACVIVVVAFSAYVFWLPQMLQKAGSVLVVLATLYVAWQLHRHASAVPPETAGTMPLLLFARAQMVRQRDALRSIFGWYILPFLPGLALVMAGNWQVKRAAGTDIPNLAEALAFVVVFGMLGFIWWLNQLGARRLQRHIDEIDALTGGGE